MSARDVSRYVRVVSHGRHRRPWSSAVLGLMFGWMLS